MMNLAKRDELLELFRSRVKENADANLKDLNLKGYCSDGDMDVIRSAVNKISANVTAAIPAEVGTPKASLYTNGTGTGENVTVLSVTLTNGWKDSKEFRYSLKVPVSDNIVDVVLNFLQSSYENLMIDVMVRENLEAINAVLDKACEMAGVQYRVSIDTPLNNGGKQLSMITDDAVVFVGDIDRLFDLDDLLVLREPDELVTEEMIEKAMNAMADEIGLSQTTPQLVGAHGGSFVKYICNIGTQVKAITMIRKVVSKNAMRLTGKKDTYAYYETDNIYAIVARVDGDFQVVLKPFNTNTLMSEDIDVVAVLKS